MSFAVGSLVRARDREWVVLDASPDLLLLRPLGGSEDEVTGIYLPLEPVEPATFGLPDPERLGDARTCRLLRDAVRLGFRHSAGPFRSFARIGIEPRPYQLVPLILALRQQPVRLLIADDVGVGKTVEAALIARELLDRGEVRRLCVLCPPHLCEQWQAELWLKFHIQAEVVVPSTVSRLERDLGVGQSLFSVYPHLIVSLDFIKGDRRRDDFLRACPELVIVDEAHTCAAAEGEGGGRHQRHQLLRGLVRDEERHLLLVTATPHSGKEDAFRALLTLLRPEFADLPEDLSGKQNEAQRRRLAQHLVQRRRGDITSYLHSDTPFPERVSSEETYSLAKEHRQLFDRVLSHIKASVGEGGRDRRQRVRWWSALALLRALSSSPAAAHATLRTRAASASGGSATEADEIGRRSVMDILDQEGGESLDLTPGADPGEAADEGEPAPPAPAAPVSEEQRLRRLLLELAAEARKLYGDKDAKLVRAAAIIKGLLEQGHHVLVFCRFIDTAEYVAAELQRRLPKDVEVAAVTGELPPDEREARVLALSARPRRVLVCTDCLSEGINLQEHFDALLHYDLSWNPTRHEQREGRIDRFGQKRRQVRVITCYGKDNPVDGLVLEVLLRKHRAIRSSLGVSVPVPLDTEQVVEALLEGLLLRGKGQPAAEQLSLFGEAASERDRLHKAWDAATDRERRSRTVFAQHSVKVEEVEQELQAVRGAIDSGVELRRFLAEALRAFGGVVRDGDDPALLRVDLAEAPRALREAMGLGSGEAAPLDLAFAPPAPEGSVLLSRTHPLVAGLAGHVMDTALDDLGRGVAHRAGVLRTRAVSTRTTALLLRLRYHLTTKGKDVEKTLLCEDCALLAFAGPPDKAAWLPAEQAEALLLAQPDRNVPPEAARDAIQKVREGYPQLLPAIEAFAAERGRAILESHRRVRQAQRLQHDVKPVLPVDVVGIYVYLPAPAAL